MNDDLLYLRSVPAKILERFLETLLPTERALAAEKLQKWILGDTPTAIETRLFARYIRDLKNLWNPDTPPKAPTRTPSTLSEDDAEQILIEKARIDPAFFIEYVSGKKPALHHRIWLANIFHPDRPFINLIAARESAKSTISLYAMAWIMGNNPLLTNALISVSDAQAKKRIDFLRDLITYNRRYQNVFPQIEIDDRKPNNTDEFTLRIKEEYMPYADWKTKRQQEGQDMVPTLMVAGMGGSGVIGSRWSGYLIVDDLVDGSMLKSERQNAAYEYFTATLLNCVTETGRVTVIGTRWMIGDFASQVEKNEIFITITIPAEIVRDDGVTVSYWPEYWPMAKLKAKEKALRKDGDNRTYRIQYLCDPKATTTGLFDDDIVDRGLPDPLPKFVYIYITTDWATGVQQRNDFTVFQAVGIDADENHYLLMQKRLKQGPETTPEELGLFADLVAATYSSVTDILAEKTNFEVFLQPLLNEIRFDLPLTMVRPKGDKDHRAKLVSIMAHKGKLFINQDPDMMEDLDVLKTEWVNFGTAAHDDTVDPMGLLIQHRAVAEIQAECHVLFLPGLTG